MKIQNLPDLTRALDEIAILDPIAETGLKPHGLAGYSFRKHQGDHGFWGERRVHNYVISPEKLRSVNGTSILDADVDELNSLAANLRQQAFCAVANILKIEVYGESTFPFMEDHSDVRVTPEWVIFIQSKWDYCEFTVNNFFTLTLILVFRPSAFP
jgi:hypothetical protein